MHCILYVVRASISIRSARSMSFRNILYIFYSGTVFSDPFGFPFVSRCWKRREALIFLSFEFSVFRVPSAPSLREEEIKKSGQKFSLIWHVPLSLSLPLSLTPVLHFEVFSTTRTTTIFSFAFSFLFFQIENSIVYPENTWHKHWESSVMHLRIDNLLMHNMYTTHTLVR